MALENIASAAESVGYIRSKQFIFLFAALFLLLLLFPLLQESFLGKELGAAVQTAIFFANSLTIES